MRKQGLYDPQFEHDSCGVGFVCDVKGRATNTIVQQGLQILEHLAHRGAVGADPKTGDGAGILIQLPHEFYGCQAGAYGTGLIFFPRNKSERQTCKDLIAKVIKKEGLEIIKYRAVPVDNTVIGKAARESEPVIEQIFISGKGLGSGELEKKL